MKPDKHCLQNKCQDIFSARMLSHEPEQSSATLSSSTYDRACDWDHVNMLLRLDRGEGGITLIHFEACLPLLSRAGSGFMEGEEALAYPLCGNGTSTPNKVKALTNYGKFEELDVVLTSKPQKESRGGRNRGDLLSQLRDDTLFYKHDKVQRYWTEQLVAADLCVEQWESVLISGLNNGRMTWSLTDTHTRSGRIYTADRRGSFREQRHCQKTSPHLPFSSSNIFCVFWQFWHS